jgi:hypothetical protein
MPVVEEAAPLFGCRHSAHNPVHLSASAAKGPKPPLTLETPTHRGGAAPNVVALATSPGSPTA